MIALNKCLDKFFILNNNVKVLKEFEDNKIEAGKSLYEVIRIIDGKPLFLKRHLDRLENSARVTGLELWLGREEIKQSILKLIEKNNVCIGNIKLVFNFSVKNNFFAYFIDHHYPELSDYENGVDTIFYFGERQNPNAKIINADFRRQTDILIKKKNVFEAILVDRNGNITEGSRSNIFFVKGENLITAPLKQVLPGTTRQVIMEACSKMGIGVKECKINYRDIDRYDALFISGTSPKVLPVKSVDNIKFNSSKNKIVMDVMKAYDEEIKMDLSNL